MKSAGALVATVLSSLSQAVCAQTGDAVDRPKACSQFEGSERLKCVDELLAEMAETPAPAQPHGPNWIISETTSPVDYRPQIAALTMARASSQDAPSSLAIHCRAQRTELTISTAGSWKPAIDGEVKVVYRINEEPSVEQRWRPAEAGKSLAFPGDVVRFLRSMPDSGQIFVKVYVGKGPPNESTFQLVGLIPSDVRSRQRATGPSPDRRRSRPSQAHLRSFVRKAYAEPAWQPAKQQRKPRSLAMLLNHRESGEHDFREGRSRSSLCDMANAASTVRLLISSF